MLTTDILSEADDHGYSGYSTNRKLSLLNEMYHRILRLEPWPCLEDVVTVNTTAGQATVTIPASSSTFTIEKPQSIVDTTNGLRLRARREDIIRKAFPADTATTGQPIWYAIWGGKLYLYPVPDGAYTLSIQGLVAPQDLKSDNSVPILLPAAHHGCLVYALLYRLALLDDDQQSAATFMAAYKDCLNDMRADLWQKHYDDFDVIDDVMHDFWEWDLYL